ncbi:MAG: hypothetical protein ACOH2N_08520 [Devosia sp.]
MQIDRRITNGLAWAGVVLVVGVPLADLISGQLMGDGAGSAPAQIAMIEPVAAVAPVPVALAERPVTPVTKTPAVQAAPALVGAVSKPVAPVAPSNPAAQTADVVDSYLQSGKALPSYITGGGTGAQSTQAAAPAVVPLDSAAPTTDPVEVAALAPAKIAPIPMPLSMRPEPALIVQETPRNWSTQISPAVTPRSSATVTYGDLQDWESGPLSEFLAKRQAANGAVDSDYDPDGFYLDEGPNGTRSRDRVVGPAGPLIFPFAN